MHRTGTSSTKSSAAGSQVGRGSCAHLAAAAPTLKGGSTNDSGRDGLITLTLGEVRRLLAHLITTTRRGFRLPGLDTLVDDAADELLGEVGEPTFDLVYSRGSGRVKCMWKRDAWPGPRRDSRLTQQI